MRALASPFPYLSLPRAACLALLAPLLAWAQVPAPPPAQPLAKAADADAPTAPLVYPDLAPQPPLPDAAASPGAWRDAHDAVAAFPRGHADILAWEAQQVSTPVVAPAHPHPMHMRHHVPRSQP
jgi:hypothetical protein